MKKTKIKILEASLALFNEFGIANVRLQQIADKAFISVGNLAYHYPSKEILVHRLFDHLVEEQKQLLASYRIVPLFDNLDLLFEQTFLLQHKYLFFYLDTLEVDRAYPKIGTIHRQHIQWQIEQIDQMIQFNISRGALRPLREGEESAMLARTLWRQIDFWLLQSRIMNLETEKVEGFKQSLWALIIPYFSTVGSLEYKQMLEKPYRLDLDN